jgi:hypothetical protein
MSEEASAAANAPPAIESVVAPAIQAPIDRVGPVVIVSCSFACLLWDAGDRRTRRSRGMQTRTTRILDEIEAKRLPRLPVLYMKRWSSRCKPMHETSGFLAICPLLHLF